jgi:hypothetical protein
LGWDQSHQLNSYQIRKGHNTEVTGKITSNVSNQVESRRQPEQQGYDDALEREKLRQMCKK